MEPTACPVCTLFLRDGISLYEHLDTHPKEQVIAALVRSRQAPIPTSQAAPPFYQTSAPCFPIQQYSGNTFTYQQIVPANGIASGTGMTPVTMIMPSNAGTMIYNPYLMPQQQQQHQLQQQQVQARTICSAANPVSDSERTSVQQTATPATVITAKPPLLSNNVSQLTSQVRIVHLFPNSSIPVTKAGDVIAPPPIKDEDVRLETNNRQTADVTKEYYEEACGSREQRDEVTEEGWGEQRLGYHLAVRTDLSDVESQSSHKSSPSPPDTPPPMQPPSPMDDDNLAPDSANDDEYITDNNLASECPNNNEEYITNNNRASQVSPVGTNDKEEEYITDNNLVLQMPSVNPCASEEYETSTENAVVLQLSPSNASHSKLSTSTKNNLVQQVPTDRSSDNKDYITGSDNTLGLIIPHVSSADYNEEYITGTENNLSLQMPQAVSGMTDDEEYIDNDLSLHMPPVASPEVLRSRVRSEEYITADCAGFDGQQGTSGADAIQETTVYEPTSPVNIIEVDGLHIMVPSQFYRQKEGVQPEDSTLRPEDGDMNVSTSYDLLARESWASDGSDAEVNASPALPLWEDRRQRKSGKTKAAARVYKCGSCGQAFNCPKERRVHRATHRADKSKDSVVAAEGETKRPKKKRTRKQCRVVFVKHNEGAKFEGVFVKDDNEVAQMEDETAVGEVKHEGVAPPVRQPRPPPAAAKCLTCTNVFASKRLLLNHMRAEHRAGGKYMCDTCQQMFPHETTFNEHLKEHPLECTICAKHFYRRQNMRLHMKRHLGIKPYQCTECGKSFVTKQKLGEHNNTHTGSAPIKCTLCPMSFRRYSNLIQHKNRFHYKLKKKVKDYVCHCGEIFHSRKKLDWHKEVHDRKPKCCTFCSERFVHTASLTRHVRRAHDRRYMPKVGREAENVECSICGHVFLRSSLLVHMRLHSGERPYSCPVCGKSFTTKWNLQQHKWTHTSRSNKPFKCTLCKSAFSRDTDFAQHMDSHRNKRQYTCNVCGEQFVRKNNCQRHVREHQAAKTFACTECGKTFHRGYYLKDHMRVHTGVRPFTCHICGKASSTKSNHNKHVKIHHAREPVNTEA